MMQNIGREKHCYISFTLKIFAKAPVVFIPPTQPLPLVTILAAQEVILGKLFPCRFHKKFPLKSIKTTR